MLNARNASPVCAKLCRESDEPERRRSMTMRERLRCPEFLGKSDEPESEQSSMDEHKSARDIPETVNELLDWARLLDGGINPKCRKSGAGRDASGQARL